MSWRFGTLTCLFQKSTYGNNKQYKHLLHRLGRRYGKGFDNLWLLKMNSFSSFALYRDLRSILDDLNNPECTHIEAVQQLLNIYSVARESFEAQGDVKKYPLIVIEGLDGSGKTAMSICLAKKLNAERWLTPPESIRPLRQFFDNHQSLRTAYYSLGNYIAALEVSCVLTTKPVVMDRFWHSTTAYALAQCVANNNGKLELPTAGDAIYKWPSDLLKPDKVLLLNVSEQVRLERHSRRNANSITVQENLLKNDTQFRKNVLQAYKNMENPSVNLIMSDGSFGKVLYVLLESIKPLLN